MDINKLNSITSNTVTNKMKMNFSQHGIPESVISDNGTQFTSQEFKNFSAEWNFHHITSSPHYPQANGEAERAVQTAKKILQLEDQHLLSFVDIQSYTNSTLKEESCRVSVWSPPTNKTTLWCEPRTAQVKR